MYEQLTDIPERAGKFKKDEVVYVSIGDGTSSEGEFWEALSTACVRQLPVLFMIEDNGYAISVPVSVQTPGGSLSALVEHVARPQSAALRRHRRRRELRDDDRSRGVVPRAQGTGARPRQVRPAVLHSLSDDEKLYKTPAERADEARRDPITKFAAQLKERGLASDDELAAILKDVDREIGEAADAAVKSPSPPRARPPTTSTRTTSIRRRRSSTPRRGPRASPTRWSPRSTAS